MKQYGRIGSSYSPPNVLPRLAKLKTLVKCYHKWQEVRVQKVHHSSSSNLTDKVWKPAGRGFSPQCISFRNFDLGVPKSFNFNATLLEQKVVFYENFRENVHEFEQYFFVSILVFVFSFSITFAGGFVLTMKNVKKASSFCCARSQQKNMVFLTYSCFKDLLTA